MRILARCLIKENDMRSVLCVALMVAAIACSGCFSSHKEDIAAFQKPGPVNVASTDYQIQPPDQIEIISSNVPELHQQKQTVRPDGKISFATLGEFDVAGKTPSQAAELIRSKASDLYRLAGDYPIDVRIAIFKSKYYYVLGQVNKPGPKPYTGRDTVMSAIAEAYPTVLAWEDRIQIIRPSADPTQKPKIFEVNWDKMAAHGDATKDVLLQEGDIIFVPPTVMAAVAMKIEEFIRPIGRAFSASYMVEGAR